MLLLIEPRRLTLQVSPGTVIDLIATDPAAPLDLSALGHLTGHTYLGPVQRSSLLLGTRPYGVKESWRCRIRCSRGSMNALA